MANGKKHAASENPPPSLWPTAWKDAEKSASPRIEREIEGKNFYEVIGLLLIFV